MEPEPLSMIGLCRCSVGQFAMRKFVVSTALASALCFPALAQTQAGNSQGGINSNNQGSSNQGYHAASGPIAGGGLPLLAVGAAGFGVYWLVRRNRRKDQGHLKNSR